MSERILEALMQLFAIMARPDIYLEEKRSVVSSFLRQQLNQEIVDQYLAVFDEYFHKYKALHSDQTKAQKNRSVSALKVLKIGKEINLELTHIQKVVVLIRLLEYAKTDGLVHTHDRDVIDTVAQVFHISQHEYDQLNKFVIEYLEEPDDIDDILLIDNQRHTPYRYVRHICMPQLKAQIKVYHVRSAGLYIMNFFGENELYLNGQFLQPAKVYILSHGSSIRSAQTKPIYFSDIVNTFNIDTSRTNTLFEARDIEYQFSKTEWGFRQMTILERSGRLVGIMGASGTGKTTLLNILNGSNVPTQGSILINGIDIHVEHEKTKGIIGYVSQDDLLIEELTVFENLFYNAKLCFSNLSNEAIEEKVGTLLTNLGLLDVRNHKVGSVLNKVISGGQRKRLNIALELMREPTVLFLDEPTSGLSSKDSENIMDLLKELTLRGKLVFVVIHQPSSAIFKMFDRLYVLDKGGFLIYRGDPVESISYFKSCVHQADWNDAECHVCGNVTPEQIFNIIEAEVVDEFGNLTHTRKVSPKEWNLNFISNLPEEEIDESEFNGLPSVSFRPPNWIQQVRIFVERDFKAKWANKGAWFLNVLLSPALALMLSYITKYYNVAERNAEYIFEKNSNFPVYLFMAVIVAIFMGLTGSAQEIIKDRKILKRERYLDLSWSSYLISKLSILLSVAALQALLFVLVGNTVIQVPDMYFPYWAVLFSIWSFGIVVGLNVSDGVEKEITIYILIPFLIIPQIILSGVIIKFDRLNPSISSPETIPWYGEIMAARWGYEALAVHQFVHNQYMAPLYYYEKQLSIANYKTDYWIPRLKTDISFIKQNTGKPKREAEIDTKLQLFRNVLPTEPSLTSFQVSDTTRFRRSNPNLLLLIKQLDIDLEALRQVYLEQFREANRKKESLIAEFSSADQGEAYRILKASNLNEKMKLMLKNSDPEEPKIIVYDDRLLQKIDPIFRDPQNELLQAHFFAPRKKLGKYYIETLWANVLVLWAMLATMYLFLYLRVARRLTAFLVGTKIYRSKTMGVPTEQ